MPKDMKFSETKTSRKHRLSSRHPYSSSDKTKVDGVSPADADIEQQKKEWDNAVCLICLEHPHNAVLLVCSSYDKGCRPYMCDTSSRHSNCLDQFRKPRSNYRSIPSHGIELYVDRRQVEAPSVLSRSPVENLADSDGISQRGSLSSRWLRGSERRMLQESHHLFSNSSSNVAAEGGSVEGETSTINSQHARHGTEILVNGSVELKCPLCRGEVTGWMVIDTARKYLNAKPRNCSHESCTFTGTYKELRKHARSVHPTAKPAEVDPARQREWHDSELSRDFDDMLSSIRSAMPNGVVFGDYIIESDDGANVDYEDGTSLSTATGSWWTRFFLVHMIGPIAAIADGRRFSARWRAPRRQHNRLEPLSRRSSWWGEWGENRMENGDEDAEDAIHFSSTAGLSGSHLNDFEPDDMLP